MRRLRLSTLLITINVGLLLLAVTGLAVVAVRLLRQLADDQALARVEQAGGSARNAVGLSGHEILSEARLLAERPTLLRLLQANDTEALTAFLTQFQQTSELDGGAVILDDHVVAQSGATLEWSAVWAAGASNSGPRSCSGSSIEGRVLKNSTPAEKSLIVRPAGG